MFSEKLNLLMNITNTSSTDLSRACNVDRTYITRLKDGSRKLPKKPKFLSDMAHYFSEKITAGYQKSVICTTLKISSWPEDTTSASKLIEEWLSSNLSYNSDITPILAGLSYPNKNTPTPSKKAGILSKPKQFYYGKDGKQEAVLQFFRLILNQDSPQTLYLYSSESMDWLFGDSEFAIKWRVEFTKVLKAGNRIKIIHNIGRNADEMLEAIAKWLPLYMTGMIEPYYYPELRQDVFQQTFFIAPETAAVVAFSAVSITDGMPNELITDGTTIQSFANLYMNFLSICRPLMKIITPHTGYDLWQIYDDLMDCTGDMIVLSGSPTLLTMPRTVAEAMQERAPESCIYERWQAATSFTRKRKYCFNITEIISPPNKRLRKPDLLCAEFYGAPGFKYTKDEWLLHADSCIQFEKKHKNYRLLFHDKFFSNICLIVKQHYGVIIIKGDAPNIAFAITEPRLVDIFGNYVKKMI